MDEKDKSQVRLGVWENLQGVWKRKVLWQMGVRKLEREKKLGGGALCIGTVFNVIQQI